MQGLTFCCLTLPLAHLPHRPRHVCVAASAAPAQYPRARVRRPPIARPTGGAEDSARHRAATYSRYYWPLLTCYAATISTASAHAAADTHQTWWWTLALGPGGLVEPPFVGSSPARENLAPLEIASCTWAATVFSCCSVAIARPHVKGIIVVGVRSLAQTSRHQTPSTALTLVSR